MHGFVAVAAAAVAVAVVAAAVGAEDWCGEGVHLLHGFVAMAAAAVAMAVVAAAVGAEDWCGEGVHLLHGFVAVAVVAALPAEQKRERLQRHGDLLPARNTWRFLGCPRWCLRVSSGAAWTAVFWRKCGEYLASIF